MKVVADLRWLKHVIIEEKKISKALAGEPVVLLCLKLTDREQSFSRVTMRRTMRNCRAQWRQRTKLASSQRRPTRPVKWLPSSRRSALWPQLWQQESRSMTRINSGRTSSVRSNWAFKTTWIEWVSRAACDEAGVEDVRMLFSLSWLIRHGRC